MPIDASIALNAGKGVTPLDNPINSLAAASQIANAQAQNSLIQAQLRKQDQDYADQQNLRGILSSPTNDGTIGGVTNALMRGGRGDLVPDMQKKFLEAAELKGKTDKTANEANLMRATAIGRASGMMTSQEGLDAAHAFLKDLNMDTTALPTTWTPDVQARAAVIGQDANQQVAAAQKNRELNQGDIRLATERDRANTDIARTNIELNKPTFMTDANGNQVAVSATGQMTTPGNAQGLNRVSVSPGRTVIDTSGGQAPQPQVAPPVAAPPAQRAPAQVMPRQATTTAAPGGLDSSSGTGRKDYTATAAGKDFQDYRTALNEKISSGGELMQRLGSMEDAMKAFNPGAGAERRLSAAAVARGLGMPDSIVQGIAGGDLASMQEFNKLAAIGAMDSLKQAAGDNKINKTEFEVFQKNNPNIELQPGAIKKVTEFMRNQFNRDYHEQQSLADYLNKNGDPNNWRPYYASQIHANLPGINPPAPKVDIPDAPNKRAQQVNPADAAIAELKRRGLM